MTPTDTLEQLAKAATPGPWYSTGGIIWEIVPKCCGQTSSNSFDEPPECCGNPEPEQSQLAQSNDADAAFIAAFNPAVALDLLTRLRAAERERDLAKLEIENIQMKLSGGLTSFSAEAKHIFLKEADDIAIRALQAPQFQPAHTMTDEQAKYVLRALNVFCDDTHINALKNAMNSFTQPAPQQPTNALTKDEIEFVSTWLAQGHAAAWNSSVKNRNLPRIINMMISLAQKSFPQPAPPSDVVEKMSAQDAAWLAGRDAAIDLASEDRFYTDGQCSWSKFMLDKYQDEARALTPLDKRTS